MTIDAYTALSLALRTGMQPPLHNKIRNHYFATAPDLIEAVSLLLHESESHHFLYTYVGGIPTNNSAKVATIELKAGAFTTNVSI